jgi:hypothetical protein
MKPGAVHFRDARLTSLPGGVSSPKLGLLGIELAPHSRCERASHHVRQPADERGSLPQSSHE